MPVPGIRARCASEGLRRPGRVGRPNAKRQRAHPCRSINARRGRLECAHDASLQNPTGAKVGRHISVHSRRGSFCVQYSASRKMGESGIAARICSCGRKGRIPLAYTGLPFWDGPRASSHRLVRNQVLRVNNWGNHTVRLVGFDRNHPDVEVVHSATLDAVCGRGRTHVIPLATRPSPPSARPLPAVRLQPHWQCQRPLPGVWEADVGRDELECTHGASFENTAGPKVGRFAPMLCDHCAGVDRLMVADSLEDEDSRMGRLRNRRGRSPWRAASNRGVLSSPPERRSSVGAVGRWRAVARPQARPAAVGTTCNRRSPYGAPLVARPPPHPAWPLP